MVLTVKNSQFTDTFGTATKCLSWRDVCLIESQIKGVIKEGTQPGFSLISKVDSLDLKVGGFVTECCRQFQAFTLSLYPTFPQKVDGSNLHIASFLAGYPHLMKTLGTTYRCSFYQGVCLIEVSIKRESTVMLREWNPRVWQFQCLQVLLHGIILSEILKHHPEFFFHSCSKWKKGLCSE